MIRFVVFLSLVGTLCFSNPLKSKYILIEDGTGGFEFIDLYSDIPQVYVEDNEVNFYFLPRGMHPPLRASIDYLDELKSSDFDPNLCTIFIVHGWKNDFTSPLNIVLREAIIEKSNCNIFAVDWSHYSKGLYLVARGAVPEIGDILSRFILQLMPNSLKNIKLMGHSLGAHICGVTGSKLKLPSIIGMDPAFPFFILEDTESRLDPSDAEFVEIIHTCGNYLGFFEPIGHVDYYPNGGKAQNGCGIDLLGSCSHSRSYLYYAESILTGGFIATQCDTYEDYKSGICKENPRSEMGTLQLDNKAQGRYYLDTSSQPPYALK